MGSPAPAATTQPSGSSASVDDPPFVLLNRQRKHRIDRRPLLRFLESVSAYLETGGVFSVVLVSDSVIRRYNRRYRGEDRATDVLSFPGDDGYLGDILISIQTAARQALGSKSLSLERNIQRLVLHGLLHLMGYDHATDSGEMRALERSLRRRFQC